MLALAGMEGASNAQSQEWHARAWRMITGTRNMELHAAARKGSAAKKILPDAGRKLAELERRFHVALYDWMASSDKKEDEWMHRLRE